MVILDITDVQPFDVLLTAGDAKLSGLIRAGQQSIRGQSAPYSHAAMFLSPFLEIESLNTPGIILSDLFEGSINPHGNGARSRGEPIFFKTTKPKTRMYSRLDGVSAEIRRFKPLFWHPEPSNADVDEIALGVADNGRSCLFGGLLGRCP